ncbi:MAG: GAF domain-containing protein [Actinomycetota bacterium]
MAETYNAKNMPDRVVKIELISYFSRYPETVATSEEMASRLDRDAAQVERQLQDLVELRILNRICDGNRTLYSYITPMSVSLRARRRFNHALENMHAGVGGPGSAERRQVERELEEEEDEPGEAGSGAAMRMRVMIDVLKREGWRECLELLMDTIYSLLGVPCAAYHLGDKCSELYWDCQRGTNGVCAGMTKVRNIQNMVIEGELIREKGFLETARHLKYLYPLNGEEDVLVCICRKGNTGEKLKLIRSMLADMMPVVAEKYRLDIVEEMTAERALQESIFASTVGHSDVRDGVIEALASVAKSVEAERVSLLVEDGNGSLRTLSTYGLRKQAEKKASAFPVGEGVAGWCAASGDSVVLSEPRVDPRYISNESDDIENMLCCPLVPPGGEAIGAICAVNKRGGDNGAGGRFDKRDMRLVEGIARTLTRAFLTKDNGTRALSRSMLDQALGAQTA